MNVKEMARKGGRACYKKHGKAYMKELGKKGAEKRWANHKKQNGLTRRNRILH
jgi:general stress protein YciG